jgi:hypothetical protein
MVGAVFQVFKTMDDMYHIYWIVIILIILFWILKTILEWEFPQNMIPYDIIRVEIGKIDHSRYFGGPKKH